MNALRKPVSFLSLTLTLLLVIPITSSAITKRDKRKRHSTNRQLTRIEIKSAEQRLSEMGYETGSVNGVIDGATRSALIIFQKWERRKVTGRLSRDDFNAIMIASAPQARDSGYSHVEVDLDRQVLLLTDADGVTKKILPVSTGSNKRYNENGMKGLAYTPRGRFRIYAKLSGWRKSPL